ncbi:MAG: ATP-dependent protease ATPase subunit HslU [Clostridia bacterium]|nr:ATP-dependent protease ATPase subunit HslU [Clostridia bacterium]
MSRDLTPREIVAELDRYIVGQQAAKRCVAIALRNRVRRRRLPPEIQEEVAPKNILLIGPTGVGKTEIARRLARLVNAPFVKVEATKFTEVGYVGRDVDAMVRDLVETAVRMVKAERMEAVRDRAQELAQERLLDILTGERPRPGGPPNPLEMLFGATRGHGPHGPSEPPEEAESCRRRREEVRNRLAAGELEGETVEIEVEDRSLPVFEIVSGSNVEELGINLQDALGGLLPRRSKRRRVSVAEARRILAQEEGQKLIDMESVAAEAIHRAEQHGIIFIDEIDKIAGRAGPGPDVSREGVQRDILPIVEGSTVTTRYGPVRTDHILFIAAGAFHTSRPSDLIPELQGRFPIRVELESLTQEDFRRILVEPANSLTRQYAALLETEGVHLEFRPDGVDAIAAIAVEVNERTENIGARRLHTLLEKLLEDVAFEAPYGEPRTVVIDRAYVLQRLEGIAGDSDLSRYIL